MTYEQIRDAALRLEPIEQRDLLIVLRANTVDGEKLAEAILDGKESRFARDVFNFDRAVDKLGEGMIQGMRSHMKWFPAAAVIVGLLMLLGLVCWLATH